MWAVRLKPFTPKDVASFDFFEPQREKIRRTYQRVFNIDETRITVVQYKISKVVIEKKKQVAIFGHPLIIYLRKNVISATGPVICVYPCSRNTMQCTCQRWRLLMFRKLKIGCVKINPTMSHRMLYYTFICTIKQNRGGTIDVSSILLKALDYCLLTVISFMAMILKFTPLRLMLIKKLYYWGKWLSYFTQQRINYHQIRTKGHQNQSFLENNIIS